MNMDWLTQEEEEADDPSLPSQQQQRQQQYDYNDTAFLLATQNDDDGDDDILLDKTTTTTGASNTVAGAATIGVSAGDVDPKDDNDDDDDNNNNINDDDDDDASRSSSSSSSSSQDDDDDDDDVEALTLLERRARNMERNKDLMTQLELHHGVVARHTINMNGKRKKKQQQHHHHKNNHKDASIRSSTRKPTGGMLLELLPPASTRETVTASSSAATITPTILTLQQQFPGRETQIRKLVGLLEASTTLQQQQSFVPAPIVITGARGTGKTAVVQAVVEAIRIRNQHSVTTTTTSSTSCSSSNQTTTTTTTTTISLPSAFIAACVLNAYVDCSTLDFPSIEEVTGAAYNQFWRQQQQQQQQQHVRRMTTKTNSGRGYKRKHHHLQRYGDYDCEHDNNNSNNNTKTDESSSPFLHPSEQRMPKDAPTDNNKDDTAAAAAAAGDEINEEELEERVERSRSRSKMTRRGSSSNNKTQSLQPNQMNQATTNSKTTTTVSLSEMFTAVWKFGCALQKLLLLSQQQQRKQRQQQQCAAILILDHAERLLSLASHKKGEKDRINFLSQIMLLPQLLRLNLTIIVISKSSLLTSSRLHIPPAQGTLAGCIQPICIRFDSYKQKSVIKRILLQPHVQRLIFGERRPLESNHEFAQMVRQSFLGTLVQSFHDTETDIREYITLGRSLWPTYVAPLNGARIDKTLEAAAKAQPVSTNDPSSFQREILAILGKAFLPVLGNAIEKGAFALDTRGGLSSPSASVKEHEFPLLTKYLLLAAFLCQVNHPDRDKRLFSIQKNGRRSRRNNDQDDAGEDIAFGSNPKDQQVKIIRPRSFPSERMLSVFISLVGLHATEQMNIAVGDQVDSIHSLGSCAFYETLAHLRGLGILHEHPNRSATDTIRLGDTRFSCSLTREEATGIAKSIALPLDRYML